MLTEVGKYVGIVHTVVAYAGFLGALMVGLALHYEKVTSTRLAPQHPTDLHRLSKMNTMGIHRSGFHRYLPLSATSIQSDRSFRSSLPLRQVHGSRLSACGTS